MIEIRIPKALLVLTEEEYIQALRRGKAIKRRRAFVKRLKKERKRLREEEKRGRT